MGIHSTDIKPRKIINFFGDNEYTFYLRNQELNELQDNRECGCFELLRKLMNGNWDSRDVSEVLRLGLIGGGLDPAKASKLVERYCLQRQDWFAQSLLAASILDAAIMLAEIEGEQEIEGQQETKEKKRVRVKAWQIPDQGGYPFPDI